MTDTEELFAKQRFEMVATQLVDRGIKDDRVLHAMTKVKRHKFVPKEVQSEAYADQALPLGPSQSISQPYIVAMMIEELDVQSTHKVLDVGTGSGYQTAVLAEIAREVYSIEIDDELSTRAKSLLGELKYRNVQFMVGDGKRGWSENGPYDRIIVSAACDEIPRELVRELAADGKMILPLGDEDQCLVSLEKTKEGLASKELGSVRFVKMK